MTGDAKLLPRLIGLRRTQEMALLNRRVDAEAAAAMGLITRAVDAGALQAEVDATVDTLAHAATLALGRTRSLLLTSFGASFEGQMEDEARAIAATGTGAEGQEGVQAFLEKRQPEWAG